VARLNEKQNKALLEQFSSEYKILQDKIDKIGAFRFTIRGWSVTLVVASIAAAGSTKFVGTYLLFLIPFIILFALAERKQSVLERKFGARSFDIESRIHRIIGTMQYPSQQNAAGSEKSTTANRGERQSEPIGQKARGGFALAPRIAHLLLDPRPASGPKGRLADLLKFVDHFVFFYLIQVIVVVMAVVLLRPQTSAVSTTVIQSQQTRPKPALANGKNGTSTRNSTTTEQQSHSH